MKQMNSKEALELLEKFEPFYLEFNKIVLYNYLGEEIQKFNLSNNYDR